MTSLGISELTASLTWIPESQVTLDEAFEASRTNEINPRDQSGQIFDSDESFGLNLIGNGRQERLCWCLSTMG